MRICNIKEDHIKEDTGCAEGLALLPPHLENAAGRRRVKTNDAGPRRLQFCREGRRKSNENSHTIFVRMKGGFNMARKRSLKNQIDYVISQSYQPGASKRAAKFDNGESLKHIYGVSYHDDIQTTAHRFAQFMESRGKRYLYGIKPADIAAYLTHRKKTCGKETMVKEISHIRKLEVLVKRVYKRSYIDWGTKKLDSKAIVSDAAESAYEKNQVFDGATADKIARNMQENSRSNAWKAVIVGRCLGCRIDEATQIKIENFHLAAPKDDPKNTYGYGYYVLPKGGHAKNNRPRIIPIHSEKDRQDISKLIGNKDSGFLVDNYNVPGKPLSTDAIAKQFRAALKRLDMYQQYKGNLMHAIRKGFAQDVYNLERKAGADRIKAQDRAQNQLGHGNGRDKRLQDTYIHNRW